MTELAQQLKKSQDRVLIWTKASKDDDAVQLHPDCLPTDWCIPGAVPDWTKQAHAAAVWNSEVIKATNEIHRYLAQRSREEIDVNRIERKLHSQARNTFQADERPLGEGSGIKRNREHGSSLVADHIRGYRLYDARGGKGSDRQQSSGVDDNPTHKRPRRGESKMFVERNMISAQGASYREKCLYLC